MKKSNVYEKKPIAEDKFESSEKMMTEFGEHLKKEITRSVAYPLYILAGIILALTLLAALLT